ncbi:VOC family protein [Shouchella miscanthi]|uniref:VOC family protein n=1 Tax=Shouchella miscanthi TaxID=2598861 RepID=UPI0011A0A276|nr:VOC family protein [Shouchella miscanthi]
MSNKVNFFEIVSKNSSELSKFYEEVFGWNIIPPQGSMEYRIMLTGDDNTSVGAVADPIVNEETWVTIGVQVDSIEETIKLVESNGGELKVPKFTTDTGFTRAYIKDSAGNIIALDENN